MSSHLTYIGQPKAEQAAAFVAAALLQTESKANGVFDSAAATDFLSNVKNSSADDLGFEPPEVLSGILDSLPEESHSKFIKAVLDGVGEYERLHGVRPTGDILSSALHQAYAVTDSGRKKYKHLLDSATTDHHDQLSLQPNRAAIAVLSAIAEAVPVANYLPTDIGSNEARLIVVTHQAGRDWGDFRTGALMDGVSSGGQFVGAARSIALTLAAGDFTGTFRAANTVVNSVANPEVPDAATAAVPMLAGRTIIYVNGLQVGMETGMVAAGNSPLSGQITLQGTSHILSGSVNLTTSEVTATFTPALPATINAIPVVVHAEGFIDYEKAPQLIPNVITEALTFKLYATPWKVVAQQTIDAKGQFGNELGLDPQAEALVSIRNQVANERHYDVLRKAMRIGRARGRSHDFSWAVMGAQKTRAQVWQDFSATLGEESQKMANATFDHGITHGYVGNKVAANIMALPRELFEPSGLADRPGIYRLGRLFGKFEIYYTPKGLASTVNSEETLWIGRSSQVARNPFVLGDAVPPTVVQLGVTRDMQHGFGFYSRQFTAVNPHVASAIGGGVVINVTNLE